uniref:Chromosome 1 open reading frame 21 n=1 Tax=Gallus gallus TaxID=9031 RepID=A0A8V0YIU7_CHICK
MGCASAKHVSTVQNEEETQKGKNYQNGDVFGDEYRIKPVEEVKYMKNGGEDDQKIAARNQENLEKSASSNVRLKSNKEIPGLVHQPRAKFLWGGKVGSAATSVSYTYFSKGFEQVH